MEIMTMKRSLYDELNEWIDLYDYANMVISVYKKNIKIFETHADAYSRIWQKIFGDYGVNDEMQKIFSFNWSVPQKPEYYCCRPPVDEEIDAWFEEATKQLKIVEALKSDCSTKRLTDLPDYYYDDDIL